MPFDQTENVFSATSLLGWLETQPPEVTYDYCDCGGGCLLDTYLDHCGIPVGDDDLGGKNYYRLANIMLNEQGNIDWLVACEFPRTYGAAAARLRSLLAQRGE